jgi:hypothetical protein
MTKIENLEVARRIDEIIQKAQKNLDAFYHNHGEWDGQPNESKDKKPNKASKKLLKTLKKKN